MDSVSAARRLEQVDAITSALGLAFDGKGSNQARAALEGKLFVNSEPVFALRQSDGR